ncbi:hypothetical protein ACVU7I_15195 [Patulibacter sp. S7RM1-6]
MTDDDAREPLGRGWLLLRVLLAVLLPAGFAWKLAEGDGGVGIVLYGVLAVLGVVQGIEALLALSGRREAPPAETTREWLSSVGLAVVVAAAAFGLSRLL